MYLHADSVTLDDDEGRFTIEMQLDTEIPGVTDEGMLRVIIHNIDLSAFYDQVKARLGPYIHEMDAARQAVARGVTLEEYIAPTPAEKEEWYQRGVTLESFPSEDGFASRNRDYGHEGDPNAEEEKRLRPFVCAHADVDESGGYDTSDPKHENFHSIHADLWDAREGK